MLLPVTSYGWWNDAWPYRLPVAIDTSATGAAVNESATEVTVLVRLHSGNFEDFFMVKEDLSDVRFVTGDDKTPLKHHVERVDLLNQLIFVWVKVPQVTGGVNTDKIWMYYGNESAVNGEDTGGSYDVNQVSVIHFATGVEVQQDQTAYDNHVSLNTAEIHPASLISSGARFDGGQGMVIADSPSMRLIPEKGYTVSAWIKPQGAQNAIVFHKQDGASALTLAIDQSALYAALMSGDSITETPRTAPLTPDVWQHIAVTVKADALSVFINGAEVSSVTVAANEIGGNLLVGQAAAGRAGFVGEMDELQVSNLARPLNKIQLMANNQGQGNKLTVVGAAEQLGNAGGTSYLVTIFKNTGTEGWVVIFLLMVMAIVSWVVILFKALYLNRVVKDNKAFMAEYEKLANQDLAALDHEEDEEDGGSDLAQALFGDHDHFQSSPFYHVYHQGIRETNQRIGKAIGAQASALNPSALNAIRSSLEAYTMREIQRLNSNMVLLTIAVSGGPFLGLLGTVIGVMVTFAAIAASGDVNIAAIAPGVAAALLTTVAGLVVAIPALFGYNWLATKIKSIISDLHVFTDEYIAKLAEQYGE